MAYSASSGSSIGRLIRSTGLTLLSVGFAFICTLLLQPVPVPLSLFRFKHCLWAWRLTVAVIAAQVLGDLINFFRGDYLRGSVGFSVATALLFYRPVVRAVFNRAILP